MKKRPLFLPTLAVALANCGPRVAAGSWSPRVIDEAQDTPAHDPETRTEGESEGTPAANGHGDRPADSATRRPPQVRGPSPDRKAGEAADEVGPRPGRGLPGSLRAAPAQPPAPLPPAVRRAVRQALQAALTARGGGCDDSRDDGPTAASMLVRSSGGSHRRPHRHLMMRPLEVGAVGARTYRLSMPAPARVRLHAATTRRPRVARLTLELREEGRRLGHTFQFTVEADAAFDRLLASRPEDGPAGELLNLGHLRRLTFVGRARSAAPRAAIDPGASPRRRRDAARPRRGMPGPPSGRDRVAGL